MQAVQQVLDALQCMALIIDQDNQVIFYNRSGSHMFGVENLQLEHNLLPGDALHCNYAGKAVTGCGTTFNCRWCDLIKIITECRKRNHIVMGECRIMAHADNPVLSYDLQVQAAPLYIQEAKYTLLSITDISHEKRRKNLERIFFHDIINIAGGLQGLVELYADEPDPEILHNINLVGHTILEEIVAQRDLTAAENGDLTIVNGLVNSIKILHKVINTMQHHTTAMGKTITLDTGTAGVDFISDARLIKRVLTNMLKNALEASETGETVTLGCNDQADAVMFWVHNPAVMPPDVQAQIFHRSFSTKGNDRGLGTYSMRLLAERYLHGSVNFHSTAEQGTYFNIHVPKGKLEDIL